VGKNFIPLVFFISQMVFAQFPARKAFLGIQGQNSETGVVVDTVFPGGTMAALKIRKGDVIQSINGTPTPNIEAYSLIGSEFRANEPFEIAFLRNGKVKRAKTKAVMRPYETSETADILYDWVKFKDGYLRSITRKPKGAKNAPAILLVPGYGCGSIENYSKSYNGKLIAEWLRNGFAIVTIEKSGVGDSFGCKPCAEVDLKTDIESFDAGYRYMEQLPFVDKSKLFIWGHSMGGTIAPEIAKNHDPRGVMVLGCVYRPWSEFLLEMHRVQKPLLDGWDYAETEDFMRTIQKIYYEFFVLKKSPEQLHANPEYAAVVESELEYKKGQTNMWGRHWRFWQQLDSVDMAKSWRAVKCPVLVVHGGTDYEQCSLVEPMLIEKAVNDTHPGNGKWITIPDMDHFMMRSKDWQTAVKNFRDAQYTKGNFHPAIAAETVKWLREKT
jgi:pimeloyl-ACP methyl ester carboxylesterase